MANNFGLGSRDLVKAGKFALSNEVGAGHMSFASARTIADRWRLFVNYAKQFGIKRMEHVDRGTVVEYGKELQWRIDEGLMKPSTGQNYVSGVNSVMKIASKGMWEEVSPVKDCFIAHRDFIRTSVPVGLNRRVFDSALEALHDQVGDRGVALVELARELGLRSKEASLLDAQRGFIEAQLCGMVTISYGTKGGRIRKVPILSDRQIALLEKAAGIQNSGKSIMPVDQSWRSWREGELREIREALQTLLEGDSIRDLRSAYACERYREITGFDAPVVGNEMAPRDDDIAARKIIAVELGHGRIEITNTYFGSLKKSRSLPTASVQDEVGK